MKQTAVEWLEKEIFRRYKFRLQQLNCQPLEEAIQQAKEIEKQQIIDAYEAGNYENGMGRCEPEQYYNDTFNK